LALILFESFVTLNERHIYQIYISLIKFKFTFLCRKQRKWWWKFNNIFPGLINGFLVILEALNFKIFRGSIPPDPLRYTRAFDARSAPRTNNPKCAPRSLYILRKQAFTLTHTPNHTPLHTPNVTSYSWLI